MAVLDYDKKEVNAKIVFYGPALSGKTTNIHYIYTKLIPEHRGELMTLSVKSHRTLFFDFLPVELGDVKGLNTRFFLYSVPGQIFYNNIRKQLLENVDGIVFVADSQTKIKQENIQSFQNLEENLLEQGRSLKDIPHVIQYNKRDMPDIQSLEDLHRQINKYNAPFFEAIATKGNGVLKTLTTMSKMVLKNLRETKDFQQKVEQGPREAYGLSDDFIVMTREEAAKEKAQQATGQTPVPPAPSAAPPAPAAPARPAAPPAAPPAARPAPAVAVPRVVAPSPGVIMPPAAPVAVKPAPAAQAAARPQQSAAPAAPFVDQNITKVGITPPVQQPMPAAPPKPPQRGGSPQPVPIPAAVRPPAPAGLAPVAAPVKTVIQPAPAAVALIDKLVLKQWGNPQLVAPNTLRLPVIYKDPVSGKEYTASITIQIEPPVLKK